MNGHDNHDEQEVPESLIRWGLSSDEITVAQSLLSLENPENAPELLFQLCKLDLICREPYVKELTASDVDYGQDRLLTVGRHARNHILRFLNDNEVPINGIPIGLYDTNGHEYRLLFVQRNDGKYVITHREPQATHWRNACQAIGLQEGDFIKLWTLRHDETNRLCFVIEKR